VPLPREVGSVAGRGNSVPLVPSDGRYCRVADRLFADAREHRAYHARGAARAARSRHSRIDYAELLHHLRRALAPR
jgi:hypothetical protein